MYRDVDRHGQEIYKGMDRHGQEMYKGMDRHGQEMYKDMDRQSRFMRVWTRPREGEARAADSATGLTP